MVKGKDPIASNRDKLSGRSSKTPSGFEADSDPDVVRIEVMSEYDFFFQFVYQIDSYNFADLKEKLKLKCDFPGFTTMLIKLINNCITDADHFKSVMVVNSDSSATM